MGVAKVEKKMTVRMGVRFAAVVLMVALSGSAFAGDFEDGTVAYGRGDYATAFSKFLKAAEQGVARAQANLGWMYVKGKGVPKNYKQAAYWWTKAAEQGVAMAQYNLGQMYRRGKGVPRDYKQAVYWYTKAAEQGDALAQFNLGLMYYKGEGVAKDDVRAYVWWAFAASQGHDEGRNNRDILGQRMTPEQIAEAQRLTREWKPR